MIPYHSVLKDEANSVLTTQYYVKPLRRRVIENPLRECKIDLITRNNPWLLIYKQEILTIYKSHYSRNYHKRTLMTQVNMFINSVVLILPLCIYQIM